MAKCNNVVDAELRVPKVKLWRLLTLAGHAHEDVERVASEIGSKFSDVRRFLQQIPLRQQTRSIGSIMIQFRMLKSSSGSTNAESAMSSASREFSITIVAECGDDAGCALRGD